MDKQLLIPVPARPMLELDLIADLACPWSYLGKRSLERALDRLLGAPVRPLRWHGFPLMAPSSQPIAWRDHLESRLPTGVTVEYVHRTLQSAGRELGINFNFDRLQYLPDTRNAHRLVRIAAREERQSEVVDALFAAFFEQGRDIGDMKVLEEVARECGLSSEALAAFANPDEARDDVAAEERRLRELGVVNTPNLLLNGRVLVPGPADVSTYIQAIDQALFPRLPAPTDRRRLH